MKLATVGKGGSGKTTIAGSLARIFAEQGNRIVAIDGDPNPNLALTLGMSRADAENITYIPPTIMKVGDRVIDNVKMMEPTMPTDEILQQYGSTIADNVDLLVMGKPAHGTAGMGCMCASHRAVRGLIAELTTMGEHTVTDMEAGLEHLRRGTARHVDMMLVVAEPYYRSLEAAMRTCELAEELGVIVRVVANKVRHQEDLDAINTFCSKHNMTVIGQVPLDEMLMDAEREEKAPYDFAPNGPGIEAIRKIATEIDLLAASIKSSNGGGSSPELHA